LRQLTFRLSKTLHELFAKCTNAVKTIASSGIKYNSKAAIKRVPNPNPKKKVPMEAKKAVKGMNQSITFTVNQS